MTRIGTTTLWAVLLEALVLGSPASGAEPASAASSPIDAALQEADRRFVAGDLAGALEALEPACSRSERPECLFGLGAIQHGLGHCLEARDYYRRYRAAAPHGEQIDEVNAALEEVEGRCGSSVDAPAAARSGVDAPPVGKAAVVPHPPSESTAPAPAVAPAPASLTSQLMLGSFAVSGAAAAASVVFGVLAANAASDCERAQRYDESFRDACEEDGPRYQGLWHGFALASGSFLGIGMALWWLDPGSTATVGVSGAGTPMLNYRREF